MHLILTDENGQGIAYDVTNANDAYNFYKLAYGTNNLFVDRFNKQSMERTIMLSPSNEKVEDADFKVG